MHTHPTAELETRQTEKSFSSLLFYNFRDKSAARCALLLLHRSASRLDLVNPLHTLVLTSCY